MPSFDYRIEFDTDDVAGWIATAAFVSHELAVDYMRHVRTTPQLNKFNMPMRMNHNGFILDEKDVF